MFGYIKPNIPELKVRDKQRYDAWYCGLCRSLGRRYGLAARLFLSYDSAFLAMIAAQASGEETHIEKHTCPVRPISGLLGRKKPRIVTGGKALDYAADVSLILAEFKLKDDSRDGKPLAAAAKLPYLAAFAKAKKRCPAVYEACERNFRELARIEAEKEPSLDLAANCFGELLRKVFENIPLEGEAGGADDRRRVLSELGFFIGRAVYLFDAWDDREKDAKAGLYNPFVLCASGEEDAEFAITYSVNAAITAFDLLTGGERADGELLENIMHQGFFAVFDSITERHRLREEKNKKKLSAVPAGKDG